MHRLALLTFLALLLVVLPGCASAGTATVAPEREPIAAARVARVEIYGDARGAFRWRLVAANGRTIADCSEGYATRRNARRAAATVVETIGAARIVEVLGAK